MSKRSAAYTHASRESGELTTVRTPIGDGWILAEDEAEFRAAGSAAGAGAGARLLPSGDACVLAQGAERELLVPDPAGRAQLWPSRVWPGALLCDGELIGVWRRAASRISLSAWRKLSSAERETIEAEAVTLPIPGAAGPLAVTWVD